MDRFSCISHMYLLLEQIFDDGNKDVVRVNGVEYRLSNVIEHLIGRVEYRHDNLAIFVHPSHRQQLVDS